MKVANRKPPRLAEKFLSWYCKPELLEDLQGDLNEYFYRNIKSKGIRRAKFIYIIDVLKFMRLYTIRKPEFVNTLINWIMLGSYVKTSARSIRRSPLFSTINIIGLAISMAVGLIMIAVLNDVFSYDTFHTNKKEIYRVISRYSYRGNQDNNFMATTSLRAARLIEESVAASNGIAILRRDFEGDFTAGDKTIPLQGYQTNPGLLQVFSFKLLKGNPVTALKEPFSLVLTESAAAKLFADEEPIGKVVKFNDRDYTVTGILQDLPHFSHMRFDVLGSLSSRETNEQQIKEDARWDNIWNAWVYLRLPPETDLQIVKETFDRISIKEDSTVKETRIELDLQPLGEIIAGTDDLGNQIGPVIGNLTLWIFGGLTFVVLLSAGFNYTNLSIARSLRRTREVGIRKVIGAMKSHVMGQFIVEAILISLIAVGLAIILFLILKPYFIGIEPEIQQLFKLELTPILLLYFIGFALLVGLLAGLFPALFFSRVNAIEVLKRWYPVKGLGKIGIRKALIVFQYTISIIFITATVISYKQYKNYIGFNLGFNTENVLNISLQGNKAELLKKELLELPEVTGISQSAMVTSIGNYWGTPVKHPSNLEDSSWMAYNYIDEYYLTLHNHKLLAGRNLTPLPDSARESEVIVNEQILKKYNINLAEALDETLIVDGKELQIVGVLENFVYGRSNDVNQKKEVLFRYSKTNTRMLNVQIQSSDLIGTVAKIETIWKQLDPVHPFEAKFYNEQIEEAFAGLRASVSVAGVLAVLAIGIASLGLLGMVVFTTETRLKEISIRKVLGAKEVLLLYLMSKNFILMLALAAAIALPLTYLFFEQVAFPEMANHAPIGIGDMLLGVSCIVLIALVLITTQSWKIARSNPAEVLKSE
ncbi:MAG: ABC transporter permease [Cyclobacteriaceae bacterium]|nr:ABC transporter permease [Cyclobacteriaceae bacterium]